MSQPSDHDDDLDATVSGGASGDDDLYDPADLADENWDDDEADSEGSRAGRKKKGGSSFFLILFLSATLFGGFVYFKYGMPPVQTSAVTDTDVAAMPAQQSDPVPSDTASLEPTEVPAVVPPPMVEEQPELPMPQASETTPSMPDSPSLMPSSENNTAEGASSTDQSLTPMPDFQVPSVVAADTPPSSTEPSAESFPPVDIGAMPPTPGGGSVPVPAATASDQPVLTPNMASEPQTAAGQGLAVDPQLLQGLREQLASLEEKMDSRIDERMKEGQAQIESSTESISSQLSEMMNRLAALETKLETVQKKKKTSPAPVKDSAPPVEKQKMASTPVGEVEWILRAVSNGTAYLSRSGSEALTPVSVGQKVDSLGTIESISLEKGRWVVRGTAGRVTH